MQEAEIKTINGIPLCDEKARESILKANADIENIMQDLEKAKQDHAADIEEVSGNINTVAQDLEKAKKDHAADIEEMSGNINTVAQDLEKAKQDHAADIEEVSGNINAVAQDLEKAKQDHAAAIEEIEKKIVQPDLSINDETDPGYVKGRTHWVEGGMVEILPECQPPFDEGDNSFYVTPANIPLAGTTCTVKWNSVEYDCVAQDLSVMMPGAVLLGNGTNQGFSGNGEPFMVIMGDNNGEKIGMIQPLDGITELTISIYQSGETIHKLDNMYLDLEWLPTAKKLSETILPLGDFDCSKSSGYEGIYKYSGNESLHFVGGRKYKVLWDGISYDCVAVEVDTSDNILQFLGNMSLNSPDLEDTGEPFGFYNIPDVNLFEIHTREQGTHTTLITENDKIPNKLPEKYLPNTLMERIVQIETALGTNITELASLVGGDA